MKMVTNKKDEGLRKGFCVAFSVTGSSDHAYTNRSAVNHRVRSSIINGAITLAFLSIVGSTNVYAQSCSSSPADSFFKNADFELRTGCPDNNSQMTIADDWDQATLGTADYFNTCGYSSFLNSSADATRLQPLGADSDGDGDTGAVGVIDRINPSPYVEYIGQCLVAPLVAGTEYTLNFQIATAERGTFGGDVTVNTLLLGVDGSAGNCPTPQTGVLNTTLPLEGVAGITTLGSTGLQDYFVADDFVTASITFTPSADVQYVMLGGSNVGVVTTSGGPYLYLDELVLNETVCVNDEATLTLEKTVVGGSAADTDFTLTATGSGSTVISGVEGDVAITSANLPVSEIYTLTESSIANYNQTSLACVGAVDTNPLDGLQLEIGETVVCTFTNEDVNTDTTLNVSKTASPDPVISGQSLTYTITVTDVSDGVDAANVVASDSLDAVYASASVSCSDSGVVDSTAPEVSCTWATIPDGGVRTMVIVVTAP